MALAVLATNTCPSSHLDYDQIGAEHIARAGLIFAERHQNSG